MSETSLIGLINKKSKLAEEITRIEELFEGGTNPANIDKIHALKKEKSIVSKRKSEVLIELSELETQMRRINSQLKILSGRGIDKILDSIEKQRWFFFKNKPKVVMDITTGILWANLEYFKFYNEKSDVHTFSLREANNVVEILNLDGYKNWSIPTVEQMITMIEDKTFPFQEGEGHRIKNLDGWFAIEGENYCIDLDNYKVSQNNVYLLPCNTSLAGENYAKNYNDKRIYTREERLQAALDMFVVNGLEPVFNDENMTEVFSKIYFEKPELIKKCELLDKQIKNIQNNVTISSAFDFYSMIEEYDLKEINNSVIKYYEAIKKWISNFLEMLDFFEKEKISALRSFKEIKESFNPNFEYEMEMTEDENKVFEQRFKLLDKFLSTSTSDVKLFLQSINKNAIDIEEKIAEINSGNNIIEDFAKLEKEKRASFELIAENTVNVMKKMLERAEYTENNKRIISSIVNIEKSWTADYKMLKFKFKEKYKIICDREGISGYNQNLWFRDWCNYRLEVEKYMLPIIERELSQGFRENNTDSAMIVGIPEKLFNCLQIYKDAVDNFYTNERKGIYKRCAAVVDGEKLEISEVEREIEKLRYQLRSNVENVMSSMLSIDDKVFIQSAMKPLINTEI